MKNKYNKFILFFILLMMFLTPKTVFADGETENGKTELWEINVKMKTDKGEGSEMYTLNQDSLTSSGIKTGNKTDAWNRVFTEYKDIIIGITGIATLTFVALFIFNFIKLGSAAGNPQARQACLTALLWTGIAAAGCGGFTLFLGFFHGLIKT